MKKLLKTAIPYLLVLVILFTAFFLVAYASGNPFRQSFTAALADKYNTLLETDSQKIVLVGGSSLAFGIRSDLLEQELHLSVVNLGTYASLGTVAMMELSLANLHPGDIVILAPELDPQTYSTYFNADVLWEAAYEAPSMLQFLSYSEKEAMAFHWFSFACQRILHAGDSAISEDSLYSRSSFNSYGDLTYERLSNIMPEGWDSSQPVSLDGLLNQDFLTAVQEYRKQVEASGADFYFTFSPTNSLAAAFSEDSCTQFTQQLEELFPGHVLGSPLECTYDAKYFYNTNYHLNDTGAILHTVCLIDELKTALGITSETRIEVPYIAPLSEEQTVIYEDEECHLSYTLSQTNSGVYISDITSTENLTSLVLPSSIQSQPVLGIYSGALQHLQSLETITIPSTVRMLDIGCFAGCENLKTIYLEITDPGSTSIPVSGLFDGTNPSLTVYLPSESYSSFLSDYTWRNYKSYFRKYEVTT